MDWQLIHAAKVLTGSGPSYDAAGRILANGDRSLPWLVGKLQDTRKLGGMDVPNPPAACEEHVSLSVDTMSDAARLFLGMLTGYRDGCGLSKVTARQRLGAVRRWQRWYAKHRVSLVWVPAAQGFGWPGHPLPRPRQRTLDGAHGKPPSAAAGGGAPAEIPCRVPDEVRVYSVDFLPDASAPVTPASIRRQGRLLRLGDKRVIRTLYRLLQPTPRRGVLHEPFIWLRIEPVGSAGLILVDSAGNVSCSGKQFELYPGSMVRLDRFLTRLGAIRKERHPGPSALSGDRR